MIPNDGKRKVMRGVDKVTLAADFDFAMEVIDYMLGDYIGEGQDRIVFEANIFENCVAKVEYTRPTVYNQKEYLVWRAYQGTTIEQWFAPCVDLTFGGSILVQKKIELVTDDNRHLIPDVIPSIFEDVKFSNCGFYNGHFCFCDYSSVFNQSIELVMKDVKMKPFESHLKEEIFKEGEQVRLRL